MKLQEHPLFSAFHTDKAKELIQATQQHNYKPGELIFKQGDRSDCLYIILEGEVVFNKVLEDGKLQEISVAHEGEMFGEIGVITHQPRSLSASAQTKAKLAIIPEKEFVETLGGATTGPIGQIFRGIIKHLKLTTEHYVDDILEKEKMAIVGKMVNALIHDFKNPFSIINMSAQLIAGEHSDDLTQELCHNIEEQIHHMLIMASEISEFSKGKQNLTVSPCNLKNLVERFLELNPLIGKNEQIELEINVPSIEIEAEDIKLLRVFQNLIVNAIDACSPTNQDGSTNANANKKSKVTVTAEDKGDEVLITFSDNGLGIPEEIQGTFFKPFVSMGKEKGTGLGTAIAKSIIESHKGSIHFKTQKNKGTIFYVTLPKKQPKDIQRA